MGRWFDAERNKGKWAGKREIGRCEAIRFYNSRKNAMKLKDEEKTTKTA